MKTVRWTLLFVAAMCLIQGPAFGVTGCSNQWLNGAFAIQFSGTVNSGAPGAGGLTAASIADGTLVAGITRVAFDGNGTIIGTNTNFGYMGNGAAGTSNTNTTVNSYAYGSIGGTYTKNAPVAGSYSVNDDCTIAITINSQHLSGTVLNAVGTAFLVQTDAGVNVSANMLPVKSNCTGSEFTAASLGLRATGTLLSSKGNSPVAATGLFQVFASNLGGSEQRFVSGALTPGTGTVSLSVASDCSVSFKSGSASYWGLITADAKRMLITSSDSNTALIGDLGKQ